MSKTIIAYTTKMGMSKQSAEIIANVLKDNHNKEIDVINLKEQKIKQNKLTEYKNIIIGSGINANRWYKQSLEFLKNDFTNKRVFVYVCSMSSIKALEDSDEELYYQKVKQYIDNVIAKNASVELFSKCIFGGKKKDKGNIKRENWDKSIVIEWAKKIRKELI